LKRAKLRAMPDAEVIGAAAMGVHKQSVSFSEDAYAFAKELVESGEYPTVSDAVSGGLERARELRAWRQASLEAEVLRRLETPVEEWIDGTVEDLMREARDYLETLPQAPTRADAGHLPRAGELGHRRDLAARLRGLR
jgi:Arc/MetJ-type ribon-helix-helix transcriptional regulator